MEGNALALMVSTASTGVLGLVFWTVAARSYPAAEVGRASAVISSATLLASLATLSLGGMYERFLPLAGHRTRSLVASGYGVTTLAALLFGAGFVLVGPSDVLVGTAEHVVFPLYVLVLTVFGLQDFVLTGLGGARWVPVKNITYSAVKLLVVILLAGTASGSALVLGWMLPALAVLLVVNGLLFLRGLRHTGDPTLPPVREVGAYYGVIYLTGVVNTVVPLVLPLMVIGIMGAEANAVFNLVWTLSSGCVLLTGVATGAFVVEAVRGGTSLRALTRRFVALLALVTVAGMVLLIGLSPWLFRLIGPEYAEQGPALARLLGLALPATAVLMIYSSLARVLRRLRMLLVVQTVTAGTVVGLAAPMIGASGITGVGWAYLIGETTAALVAVFPLRRLLRELRAAEEGPTRV